MMREDIRKERVRKFGSFLFCPERNTDCFALDNEFGFCERESCFHDDPEYIAQQKRIEINRERNAREEERKEAKEKAEAAKPIKKKSSEKLHPEKDLVSLIARKEKLAERAYRENRPKQGDAYSYEANFYRRELRAMKERYTK